VHIVWEGNDVYGTDIYYARTVGTEASGDSFVAQVLTVPPTMTAATLSLLYQLDSLSPESRGWFAIAADDGVTSTVLFSTTARTDGWEHHWLDLSAWASQTVTLTLNLHQTAGPYCTWAYLDEVSLGSTYPDLYVRKTGVGDARPGDEVVYTISLGNRGGAQATGARITDTLPAGLSFLGAAPPPLTTTLPLRWDLGDLPAQSGPWTIVVTATVAPTVPMFTTFTNTVTIACQKELETANNLAWVTTWIGYRIYLPLVAGGYASQ